MAPRLLVLAHQQEFFQGPWLCFLQPGLWGYSPFLLFEAEPMVHQLVILELMVLTLMVDQQQGSSQFWEETIWPLV